jgi:hypothetical protein
MKSHPPVLRLLVLCVGLAALSLSFIRAQEPSAPDPDIRLTPPQLEQLLGPIALYPDALVALILPASTVPTDIVLAAHYLNAAGSAAEIDGQGWNDSVKALARYPQVIKWMDENLAWTQQMGAAFLAQQTEVMTTIQRLRARARATGALANTPEQQVVEDEGLIAIVPTQSNVIYVPRYDPDIVYVADPDYSYNGPYLTFGYGFPTGYWLSYEFDWRRRSIWVGDPHQGWYRPGSPGRPNYPYNPNWHPWKPPVNRPPPPSHGIHRPRPEVARPRPFPGTPPSPRNSRPTRPDAGVRPSASNQSQAAAVTDSSRNPSGWNPGPAARTPVVPMSTSNPPQASPNRAPQIKTAPSPRVAVPASAGSSTPPAVPSTPPAPASRDNASR